MQAVLALQLFCFGFYAYLLSTIIVHQQFQIQTVTHITDIEALLCILESLSLSLAFLALIDRITSSRSGKKPQDVRNNFDLRLNKKLQ